MDRYLQCCVLWWRRRPASFQGDRKPDSRAARKPGCLKYRRPLITRVWSVTCEKCSDLPTTPALFNRRWIEYADRMAMKIKRILKHKHFTSLFILWQIPGFTHAHKPLKGDFQKTNSVNAVLKKTLKWASFSGLSFSLHFHLPPLYHSQTRALEMRPQRAQTPGGSSMPGNVQSSVSIRNHRPPPTYIWGGLKYCSDHAGGVFSRGSGVGTSSACCSVELMEN